MIGDLQACCDNPGCAVFMWELGVPLEELMGNVNVIDLKDWPL